MTITYIDYQNITRGFEKIGYQVNRGRFYIYLKDKYKSQKMCIFMGYLIKYEDLYEELRKYGFHLHFRDAVLGEKGRIKANIDTDLVLQSLRDYYEHGLTKGILVSCDGDFDCLVRFRYEKGVFGRLFYTRPGDLSELMLKYTNNDDISTMIDLGHGIIQQIKKDP